MRLDENIPLFSQNNQQQSLINDNFALKQLKTIVEECIVRLEFFNTEKLDENFKKDIHAYFEDNYLKNVNALFIKYTEDNAASLSNTQRTLKNLNLLLREQAHNQNWTRIMAERLLTQEKKS